ncbi:MAG: hypothetical protein R3C10_27835 [Pirellulales bacterium]
MTDGPQKRLSRELAREVDRRAMDEYGIPGIVLMENAGRGVAEIIVELVRTRPGGDAIGAAKRRES